MRRVEFVSFDHVRVLQLVVAWEACFLAMRRLCRRSSTPTVREHGASYCCSVINASWCTLAGAYLTRHLASMPTRTLQAPVCVAAAATSGTQKKANTTYV